MFATSTPANGFTPIYGRYRFIALAVYGAILVAGVIDQVYGGIGLSALIRLPEGLRFGILVAAMLGLIGLELARFGHADFKQLARPQLIPFVLRLLLVLSVLLVTDLHYTRILFLILILYSYLAVSHSLSYGLAALGVVALLGLSITQPVFMGIVPAPPQVRQVQQPENQAPPPRPTRRPINIGGLIDASMGSVIALFFTLLLARAMAQSLQDQQKLEASHVQLQQYASRVAELATTEERNRLARDIHDSLGHYLAAINIQLEKASAYRERDPQRANEAVNHARRSVQDAFRDVRESVSSLREKDEAFSLEESINALVARMAHSRLDIRVTQTGDSTPYGRLALMTLYRVIQEALTNVHKHAQASLVTIHLDFSDEQVHLDFTDNGAGFDVSAWEQDDATSYGLRGLQERLSLIGGKLNINSQPHQTTLNVILPKLAHG